MSITRGWKEQPIPLYSYEFLNIMYVYINIKYSKAIIELDGDIQ